MLGFLYLATCVLILWLCHRFVRSVSRAAALVLIVLPLTIVGTAVATGGVYGPLDHSFQHEPLRQLGPNFGVPAAARNASAIDIYSEFFPWRLAVQRSLAAGEWPLWNPWNLAGHPLAAEVQAAPYFPFTWIACLLPAAVSMTYTAAIGLFLAAIGAFLLARELECRELSALVAAAGWSLASCNVLYIQTAMGMATVLLPLLFLACRRVVRTPGLPAAGLLTCVLCLTILAGHPESLFLNVLVSSAVALFELVRNRRTAVRAIGWAVGAGLVAAAICAISLVPLLEAIPQSSEYRMKVDAMSRASQKVSGQEALANLLTDLYPHLHVREWAKPRLGRIGAETAAVGALLWALALYVVWRKRTVETWFFAAMAVFCAVAGARWEGIADVVIHLPLLEITLLHRLAFSAALFVVLLATLGVDELLVRQDRRAAAWTIAGVLVALTLGHLLMSGRIVLAETPADYGRYRILAELIFSLAAVVLLLTKTIPTRAAATLLLVLVIAQRALSEIDTFPTYPAAAAYPRLAILDPLQSEREPFRLVGIGEAMPPATNVFYGFEDPRGYDAMTLDEFQRTWKLWCRPYGIWFNRVDDLSRPILSFLNVRFALQSTALPIPDGWRELRASGDTRLLKNERALDRVFVPARVELTGASAVEVVDRMEGVADFREYAYITRPGDRTVVENGPGRITLRSRRLGGEYRFEAEMAREGFVVISDSAWKGWRAFVDGARVPLYRANASFLGVPLPAGRHEVRVVYWPASFVRGRAITLATIAILLLVALVRGARKRLTHRTSQ